MELSLIEKQVLYDGKKVRLEAHHFEDENGRRHTRELCVHPGAVVVLPFLDNDTILLIKNRRYVVNQWLIELPAGTLEEKEPPINCAGRELIEETGYLARRIKPISSFFSSPGILSEAMHAFAAFDLEHRGQQLEAGEEVELLPTHYDRAIEMIKDGAIRDGKTIATLLSYDRFHRGK